jgi:putative PEP-CTERM system TPR-repeat lipoprotein
MNVRAAIVNTIAVAGLCCFLVACGSGDPDAMLASAKDYLAKNDAKSAVIQLKNALEKNPDIAEARFLLGRTLLESGDTLAAEKELRRARDLKFPAAQVDPPLALAWVRMGENQKVVDELSQVQGATPRDNAMLKTAIGQAQFALGKPDLAQAAFADAEHADPGYAPALIGQARVKAQQTDLAGALALADKALALDPKSPDSLQFKGDVLFAQHQTADAITVFRTIVAQKPNYLSAHWALIAALERQGDAAGANQALAALQAIAPKHPQTYYFEALVRAQEKNYPAARDAIQQQLALFPNNSAGMLLAAGIDYEMGAYDRAEVGLVRVLQKDPANDYARRLLVGTFVKSRQPAKALDAMKPMLGRFGSDAVMENLAGEVYLLNGDPAEAAGHFEKATKIDPAGARQKAGLALTRLAQGDAAGGVRDLELAATSDSGTRSDLMLISVAMRQQQWDKALTAIDALEKKEPGKPLAANLRGLALLGMRDTLNARKSFERALAIDPGYFPAAANLARLDLLDKNPAAAQQRFEDMLLKNPRDSQALLALAEIRTREKAPAAEVVGLLNRAVTASPTEVAPRLALMQYYVRANEAKKAVLAGQDALNAIPGRPELLDALGQAQQAAGDDTAALASYGRFAEVAPDSPLPYLRMAALRGKAGNYEAAAQNFEHALVIKPDLLEAQRGLVAIDVGQGRSADALARARTIEKQRPKEAVGFIVEGDIYAQQKDWPKALAAYRSGMKLVGASESAIKAHAVMVESGQTAEADKMATAWLREHPGDDPFVLSLAELAGRHKDYAAAMKYYLQLIDKQPENALLLNNFAFVAGKANDPRALQYAEKAIALAPDQPAILDTLGTLLVERGDATRGLAMLRKATDLAPGVPAIRLNLARALVKSGQKDAARKELDTLTALGAMFADQDEVTRLRKGL